MVSGCLLELMGELRGLFGTGASGSLGLAAISRAPVSCPDLGGTNNPMLRESASCFVCAKLAGSQQEMRDDLYKPFHNSICFFGNV